jgi:hypothetical protein
VVWKDCRGGCLKFVSRLYMYKLTIETGLPGEYHSCKSTAPLLSDLYIQLPKPQPTKKYNPQPDSIGHWDSPRQADSEQVMPRGDSNCYLFSGTRTKNSSTSLPYRSESEIISEWVRSLFQKKGLLGPGWEVKMAKKRRDFLRVAFSLLKEYESRQPSAYLQTQSRYKPPLRSCNQLQLLGLERLAETVPRLRRKKKQEAFSIILRFLALRNGLFRSSQKDSMGNSIAASVRESGQTLSPRTIIHYRLREDYKEENGKTIRHVQSSKHLPVIDNEYALAPASPIVVRTETPKEEERVRTPRGSMQHGLTSSKEPVTRFDYAQHQPVHDPRYELIKMKESQFVYTNPPSPKSHQFAPMHSPHPIFQAQPPPQIRGHFKPTRNENIRFSMQLRPNTHNPFSNNSTQKDLQSSRKELIQPEFRSRAVSVSASIKISFMGQNKTSQREERKALPDDY